MTSSAWEAFRARLAEDERFREQLTRSLGAGGRQKVSLAELVAFARTLGYEFSERDVLSKTELTDEELEKVAGGSGPATFDCSELVQWAAARTAAMPKAIFGR